LRKPTEFVWELANWENGRFELKAPTEVSTSSRPVMALLVPCPGRQGGRPVGSFGFRRSQSKSHFNALKGCWVGEMLRGVLVLAALCNIAGDAGAHISLRRGSGAAASLLSMPRASLMRLRGGIGAFPDADSCAKRQKLQHTHPFSTCLREHKAAPALPRPCVAALVLLMVILVIVRVAWDFMLVLPVEPTVPDGRRTSSRSSRSSRWRGGDAATSCSHSYPPSSQHFCHYVACCRPPGRIRLCRQGLCVDHRAALFPAVANAEAEAWNG